MTEQYVYKLQKAFADLWAFSAAIGPGKIGLLVFFV